MAKTDFITRAQFLDASQARQISVEELKQVSRLNKIDVQKADLNGDGVLLGRNEANALFDELDTHDGRDRDPHLLILKRPPQTPLWGLSIPFLGSKTTKVGNAVEALAAVSSPELQRALAEDPFAEVWVLPEGPNKGERVDTREKRSMKRLTPKEAKPYLTPEELQGLIDGDGTEVIANFRHEGRFWVAVIPPDAVEEMIVQQEDFDAVVPAAHGQIGFKMHEGKQVKLVSQVPSADVEPVFLDSIVYSAEAAGILGRNYNLVEGTKDYYVIAHRLVSNLDRARDALDAGQTVHQYRIQLPPELDTQQSRNTYFQSVLNHATDVGMTEIYHTVNNNCILAVFRHLDALIDYNIPRLNWDFYPSMIRDSLRDRKVLDPKPLLTLADEYSNRLEAEFSSP